MYAAHRQCPGLQLKQASLAKEENKTTIKQGAREDEKAHRAQGGSRKIARRARSELAEEGLVLVILGDKSVGHSVVVFSKLARGHPRVFHVGRPR